MLNAKQERFCQEYIIDLNATEAAIRAGYSKKTARSIGCENLTKPDITERIEVLMLERKIRCEINGDLIIKELQSLGFYSVKTFLTNKNTVTDLKQLSNDQLRPVIGIKVKETTITVGKTKTTEVTTELKFADKRAALVDLGRHVGIFEKDNNQQPIKIKITRK